MKQKTLLYVLHPILLLVAGWLVMQSNVFNCYLVNQESTGFGWNLVTHRGSNATFWWLGFAHSINTPLTDPTFLCSSLALVALVAANFMLTGTSPLWLIGCSSLTLMLFLLVSFGPDPVTVNFLVQFLALTLLMRSLRISLTKGLWAALIVAGCALILCSQWSYLTLLCAALLILPHREKAVAQKLTLQYAAALLVIALFLTLVVQIQFQRPALPSFGYPASGRVVPDDGLAGVITPLIGESSEIPYINHAHVARSLLNSIHYLAIFTLLSFLFTHQSQRKNLIPTLLLILSIYWDIALGDAWCQIGPISSMRRILPGIFPLSITPYLAALAFCWLTIELSNRRILLLAFYSGLVFHAFQIEQSALFNNSVSTMQLYSKLNREDKKALASPSFELLNNEGIEILNRLRIKKNVGAYSIKHLQGTIEVSHQKKKKTLKILSDERAETRWSPNRGAQYGNEWIRFLLPQPVAIEGLELQPGKFFSDFARGLEIVDCTISDKSQAKIKHVPSWQGGIELSDQGYPYYTGQHDVTIIFPQAVTTACIQINQTGEDQHYDWSIAELRVLTKNQLTN